MYRVDVLGPVRVVRDGRASEPRGVTGRTLLALLAAHHDAVVSVDDLVAGLWEDLPPRDPVASVRVAISRLRTMLPARAIESVGSGQAYELHTDAVPVDLAQFEQAAAALLAEPASTEAAFAAALAMWRGRPFAGARPCLVLSAHADRLEHLRTLVTQRHRSWLITEGHAAAALRLVETDLDADPLSEFFQLLRIDALVALGRVPEALRGGSDYVRRLADRSGLEPSPVFAERMAELAGADRPQRAPAQVLGEHVAIGRERELAQVRSELARPGVVSIVGLGGIGKTRLAREVLAGEPGEAVFVALGGAGEHADIGVAVGAHVGLQSSDSDSVALLMQRLEADDALLVLDNCEHVLPSVREFADRASRDYPGLRLLLTSRVAVGAVAERVVRLGPLEVPAEFRADTPVARLFIARALQAGASIDVDADSLAVVKSICDSLDGVPLALELAAARVPTLGLHELARRLPTDISVLRTTGTARRPRLDDVIAWSLAGLSPDTSQLFDQLAVFPAGFTLAAVEAVTGVRRAGALVGQLLDVSLVIEDSRSDDGRHRLRLLEPVRATAASRLSAEAWRVARDGHASWVASVAEDIAARWAQGDTRAAIDLMVAHRADVDASVRYLAGAGRSSEVEQIALRLTPLFIEYRELVVLDALTDCFEIVSEAGHAAQAILAMANRRENDAVGFALESSAHARRAIDAARPGAGPSYAHLPLAYAMLILGQLDDLGAEVDRMLRSPAITEREAAQVVAIAAIALAALGRPDDARAYLTSKVDGTRRVRSGGLVELAWAFAEVDDAEASIGHCRSAIAAAADDRAVVLRLIHQEELLWLLASNGRTTDAVALARELVPAQIEAGLRQVAWVSLRVVARLLADVGRMFDAAHLVASIDKGAGATPLSRHADLQAGVCAEVEAALGPEEMTRVRAISGSSLAHVWREVDAVLAEVVGAYPVGDLTDGETG